MHNIKKFEFCGLPVSSFEKEELNIYLKNAIKEKKNITIYGHSLGILPRLMRQPETVKYIMDYDLYVSDGYQFHVFGKLLGFPFQYRISLPEITYLILDIANQIGLLGANKVSNKEACEKIMENYPNIISCNGIDGYFNTDQEEKIIQKINEINPDILFLGMPSPKKEKFLHKNKQKLQIGISVLNGGMIDVLSGRTVLTPYIIKKMGLALLFRFLQTPKAKIKQFLIYYPLIIFYFIPLIIWNYKIKKNNYFTFRDFYLIKRKLKKYNILS
jgi:N-acetylglucosaminyldiphosphoundecaprenol N-acetyl-beta-D-mannosaminyltransferase